jgi:predicted RNase H-like nuclease
VAAPVLRFGMLVLGIDAAWKECGTSGVALLKIESGGKRTIAATSSYADFIISDGKNIAQCLLRSAEVIGGQRVDVVAIDMPISRCQITGRREADNAVSRAFGRYGAGTHSPNEARPGHFGRNLYLGFAGQGYEIATVDRKPPMTPCIVEVFPLAALVRVMRVSKRPPYKVAKTRKYWPALTPAESIDALLEQWRKIELALSTDLVPTGIEIPNKRDVESKASLKPFEDKLDAIVCAWVGARYLEGRTEPFGDADAAIWVPKPDQEDSYDDVGLGMTTASEA